VPNDEASRDEKPGRPDRRTKWAGVLLPACVVLVVSIPAMIVEEDWHGQPMIDEGTHLWILPALLVAGSFLLGGALAGFRFRSSAVAHAGAVASFAVAVLVLGAVFRRFSVVHEGVPNDVVRLWILGALAALVLCVLGSLLGRWVAAEDG
jgi:VIT1/CCC1 family predicted Fe2+/Mn2+ transporter